MSSHGARELFPAVPVVAAARFDVRECLGSGGFGTVYAAFDRVLSSMVAVKVLARANPEAVLAFKREFRELQDVQHPNLVQLRELLYEDEQWVLIMELVRGADLLEEVHRQPDPGRLVNEARLRESFLQLTHGLHAIHASGHVHRDVKASNIKVTPEGRTVLLDFGLVTRTDATISNAAGTVAYMAPEQAAGDPLTGAADFYGLGIVLYQALTGVLPFGGSQLDILLGKQKGEPKSVREAYPELSSDWDVLLKALLDPKPERRPNAKQLIECFSSGTLVSPLKNPTSAQSFTLGGADLVGREAELETLRAAITRTQQGTLAYVGIFGDSGIGKTRLVESAIDHTKATSERMLVLRARCYENETAAFKALDSIVDAVVHELRHMSDLACRAILPRRAFLLPLVFPAMGRVRAIAEMSRTARESLDRITLRSLVFEALRELLGRLSEHTRVVVVIDDIQWADGESMELLSQLFRQPHAPALCLITICRPLEQCGDEVLRGLSSLALADDQAANISLARLTESESVALALSLMQDKHEAWAQKIAGEADGQPLFIELLVRHSEAVGEAKTLDEALLAYVASLNRSARSLLELSCMAGTPIPRASLLEACDVDGDTFSTELMRLRLGRLVRTHRAREVDTVEPFHDRIRQVVLADLPEATLQKGHRRIALVLDALQLVDRERVAQHWFLAGMPDRAAKAALAAADQASAGLAFGKAARLYGWAEALDPELKADRSFLVRWGDSLANAGRSSDAANILMTAVAGATAGEVIELKRRCAELLIQSGRLPEGLKLAHELCHSVGLSFPDGRAAAIRQLTWHGLRRAFVRERFDPRPAEKIAHGDLIKLDVLWSLASRLGPIEPFVAGALHARYYLLALETRESGRLAQALATDVFAQFFRGRSTGVDERLRRAAELAELSGRPEVRAFVLYMRAASYAMLGEHERALAPYQQAEVMLSNECSGLGWLLGTARTSLIHAAKELGRWDLIAQRYAQVLLDARERGDPYLHNHTVLTAAHVYSLMQDRPEAGLDAVLKANQWAGHGAHAVYQNWIAQISIRAYEGDELAWESALLTRKELANSGTMRMPANNVAAKCRTALAALAEARRKPTEREPLLELAQSELRGLELMTPNSSRNVACEFLKAALHDARAENELAADAYQRAEHSALAAGRMAEADAARARRGQLLGNGEGQALLIDVQQRLRQQGVKHPLRFLNAMLPGVLVVPHEKRTRRALNSGELARADPPLTK
jgi:tetratricopeptide (TPR) repeat protein